MHQMFYKKIFNYLSMTLLLLCVMSYTNVMAQTVTITGKVADQNGESLPGVTVQVAGTNVGSITSVDGNYSINVPPNATLHFSFVGYIPQDVAVGDQRMINVTLQEDVSQIEEVVVVGYGTMRKSDVTGAVLSVTEAQLKDRPVTNAMEALQGKAAGVDITNNARPGELGEIRIRGERSITGSSAPLYVVDGIPMMGRNNINSVNTNDIKSIDILKDASATAIYGSRGANGVILITTHNGEAGRFSVKYDGSVTIETFQDSQKHLNSAEWLEMQRWSQYYFSTKMSDNEYDPLPNPNKAGAYPRGDNPTYDTDKVFFGSDPFAWRNVEKGWASGTWDGSKVATTDWTKFIKRTGINHNHNLSVSGGTEKMNAYASVGYFDMDGTNYGQSFKRYSTNLSVTMKPLTWFEMGGRINGSMMVQEYGQDNTGRGSGNADNLYLSAMRLYPWAVPYDDDGNRIHFPGGNNKLRTVVDEIKYTHNERQIFNVNANVYAVVKLPLDGLSYRVEFGPGIRFRRNGVFVDPESAIRESSANLVTLSEQRDFSWTVNNLLFYNKVYDVHSMNFTALQTASKVEEVSMNIDAGNMPVPEGLWHNLSIIDKADVTGFGSSYSGEQLTSYMIRGQYTYNNRYSITASGRWDGASQLAPGHKWAFFPAVALAWRLEQENFMSGIKTVDALKLRLGYGVTGNAAVSRYVTISDLASSLYPYGSNLERFYYYNDMMLMAGNDANPYNDMPNYKLGWERTGQFNIGIDFSILKNRISGVIDVYKSYTNDLLLRATIPALTGYPRTTANIGKTENHGVDITLNTINIRANGFKWETSLNAGWQQNKIVELSSGKNDEIVGRTDSRFIGQPIRVFYDFKYDGIWKEEDAELMKKYQKTTHPETGEPKSSNAFYVGQIRPLDVNGDYEINPNDDRVIIGQQRPSWSGGMNNVFSYKGVELSIQIYGRLGYWTDGANVGMGGFYMVSRKVDYYNENNKNAKFQRLELTSDGHDEDNYNSISGYVKGNFINIRNISLGYVFPKNMIQSWGGMQNLRVYAQVVNPGAIYSACDFKNMDMNSPYWNRNFIFGLNVGF